MPAFVVVDIEVHDPADYEGYKTIAAPAVAQYGGKYLVRGGQVEILEGDWMPKRFVILEFPSVERAKAWWSSTEYAQAKKIRHRSAHTNMIVVEGRPPA